MASPTAAVTQTGGGVLRGFGAGTIIALAMRMLGPIIGTLVGAVGAGMLMKQHRGMIALIAGMFLALAALFRAA